MRIPKYRHQKDTGRAFVEIAGKRTYLGKFNSEESQRRYAQILQDLKRHRAKTAPIPPDSSKLLIEDLVLAYWEREVTSYYVKHGQPTSEQACIRAALRWLIKAFGSHPARSLDALMLESVRDDMLKAGTLCRKTINGNISRIRRLYKWAAKKKLIDASVWHELRTVDDLKSGRSPARDPGEVPPVDDATVDATLPFLSPVVQAMVRFQRLTGCRPAEVCLVRPCDIEGAPAPADGERTVATIPTPDVALTWCYRPHSHKMEHLGRERRIYIGPKGQAILMPWLDRPAESYCFNPRETARRKETSGPAPDQCKRAKPPRPGRRGMCYTTASYRVAIHRACERAFGMPKHLQAIDKKLPANEQARLRAEAAAWRAEHYWSPNQLRHTLADVVDAQFDLIGVQSVLGHKHAKTSEIYTRRDAALAASIMAKIG